MLYFSYLRIILQRQTMRIILPLLIILSSCKLDVKFADRPNNNINNTGTHISGIISPFLDSIVDNSHTPYLISPAMAAICSDPVYAKLYQLQNDGTVVDSSPISSMLVGPDARYSFNMKALSLTQTNSNVQFVF